MGVVPVESPIARPNRSGDAFHQLMDASRDARERAGMAIRHSEGLVAAAKEACKQAQIRCLQSRPHKVYACVTGEVEGQPVHALVRTDGSIVSDAALRSRADLLVRMGETFDGGVRASLCDSPLATSLTLIRACDRVTDFEVVLTTGHAVAAS